MEVIYFSPTADNFLDKFSQQEHEILKKAAEARKEGKRLPEYDEKGQLVNPYIPMYISRAPWYMQTGQEGQLDHQRTVEKQNDSSAHHIRGILEQGEPIAKFRKGACENCGSMTHKRKDCLERPRKRGAKWTGSDIKPDEFIQEAALDFEGKRDRWAGYEAEEYEQVIETWEQIESERQAARIEQGGGKDNDGGNSSSDEEDEIYAETVDMPGQKVDLKTRMTVRNLRLREDTAKYLHDLSADPSSYDPKTRSMRKRLGGDSFVAEEEADRDGHVFAWESKARHTNPEIEEVSSAPSFVKKSKINSKLIERYEPVTAAETGLIEHSEGYIEYDGECESKKKVEK
jgi:pre-mRNA-processing factor SLU7